MALTAITIKNLKPRPVRYEISDDGCRGLRVVVFPSGKKSFICRFRFRGIQRKMTLGPVADIGQPEPDQMAALDAPQTLASARAWAAAIARDVAAKKDPAAVRQATLREERAEESDTLEATWNKWLKLKGRSLRTIDQREADMELLFEDGLRRLPVAAISRLRFTEALDRIAENNSRARADRVRGALRALLNWRAGRGGPPSVLGRGGQYLSANERQRPRVLSDAEIRAIWHADPNGVFGQYIRFTLLTACRRGESGALRRGELSADGMIWTIPGERYKTGRALEIPLSPLARSILASMPELPYGDHVFSRTGGEPLAAYGKRKAVFDAQCGVTGWRIHDLRRTARTRLADLTTPDIAERCLGHALGGIRAVYDQSTYREPKRIAFEKLADEIERIVKLDRANVSNIADARRG